MSEKQPVMLHLKNIGPSEQGNKAFGGFAIHGVFMGPNPEPTDAQQKDLQEKIRSIQQHRN